GHKVRPGRRRQTWNHERRKPVGKRETLIPWKRSLYRRIGGVSVRLRGSVRGREQANGHIAPRDRKQVERFGRPFISDYKRHCLPLKQSADVSKRKHLKILHHLAGVVEAENAVQGF